MATLKETKFSGPNQRVRSSNFICVDSSVVGIPISLPLATAPLGRVVDTTKISDFWSALYGF